MRTGMDLKKSAGSESIGMLFNRFGFFIQDSCKDSCKKCANFNAFLASKNIKNTVGYMFTTLW
jgi:hypothetical protein